MQIRKHVFYDGMVQGVGFRYTARRLARDRAVTGFVRNLADGRVELVAEGDEGAVEAFLEDVADSFRGHIRGADISAEPATGEFRGFGVSFDG